VRRDRRRFGAALAAEGHDRVSRDGQPRANHVEHRRRVGCDEADRRAIIGGMATSTIHVLIITPVIFYIMKARALRNGTLRSSLSTSEQERA
jgi:hypothetical protein